MATPNFTALYGSTDDIAKAQVIRAKVLPALTAQLKLALTMVSPGKVQRLREMGNALIAKLQCQSHASWWIENEQKICKLSFTKLTA